MRIKAVIIEGEADAAAIAAIRAAIEAPDESVIFARPSVAAIVSRVAYETGLTIGEIAGAGQRPAAFRARCAVSVLARDLSGKSTTQIGVALGDRDHTTIMNALARAKEFEAKDPAFRSLVKRVADHLDAERMA